MAHSAQFLDGFLAHCDSGANYVTGATGAPLDFISCHLKGTTWPHHGTWVQPSLERMNTILTGYVQAIKKHPTLSGLEVHIDECDIDVGTIMGVHDNPCLEFRNTEYFASWLCRLAKHLLDVAGNEGLNLASFTSWNLLLRGQTGLRGQPGAVRCGWLGEAGLPGLPHVRTHGAAASGPDGAPRRRPDQEG